MLSISSACLPETSRYIGQRGDKGRAEADGHHDGKQEQTGLALHRRTKPSQVPVNIILSFRYWGTPHFCARRA